MIGIKCVMSAYAVRLVCVQCSNMRTYYDVVDDDYDILRTSTAILFIMLYTFS